jgi:hypothetical protein
MKPRATNIYVLPPSVARANPVMVNPASLLALYIVTFWSVVVEAGQSARVVRFQRGAGRFRFGMQSRVKP